MLKICSSLDLCKKKKKKKKNQLFYIDPISASAPGISFWTTHLKQTHLGRTSRSDHEELFYEG